MKRFLLSAVVGLWGASLLLAVDGTIVNASKAKPQAGVTVSSFKLTQGGPQLVASVKSGADGSFNIPAPGAGAAGPQMVQAVYGGVTYTRVIPPGTPSQGLKVEVYESASKAPDAKVAQHYMLLEPANGQLTVNERFMLSNTGKVTWNDPDRGTLRFYVPAAAGGKMTINTVAPGSVPVQKAADKTEQANVYKLDFAVKPGDSEVDLAYQMPFTSPGTFTTKMLFAAPNTKVLAPNGVTLAGAGLQNVGQEPQTKATVYNFDGVTLEAKVEGTGMLSRGGGQGATDAGADTGASASSGAGDAGGAQIAELMPQLYNKVSPVDGFAGAANAVKWILLLALGMLTLAFVYLYRRPAPESAIFDSRKAVPTAAHERGR